MGYRPTFLSQHPLLNEKFSLQYCKRCHKRTTLKPKICISCSCFIQDSRSNPACYNGPLDPNHWIHGSPPSEPRVTFTFQKVDSSVPPSSVHPSTLPTQCWNVARYRKSYCLWLTKQCHSINACMNYASSHSDWCHCYAIRGSVKYSLVLKSGAFKGPKCLKWLSN